MKIVYVTGGVCRKGVYEEWTGWLHKAGAIMDAHTMGFSVIYRVKINRVHANGPQ